MCTGDCNEPKKSGGSKTKPGSKGKGVMAIQKPPNWTTKGKTFGSMKK